VTEETIADAERALLRLDALARRFDLPALGDEVRLRASDFEWTGVASALFEGVTLVLDEDLNTPLAVAQLFEAVSAANAAADRGEGELASELAEALNVLFGALGLSLLSGSDVVDVASEELVAARDLARVQRDWAAADRLRDELVSRGWVVEDSAEGTLIRRP
jgi:cysteinyl-tRNA synthetase